MGLVESGVRLNCLPEVIGRLVMPIPLAQDNAQIQERVSICGTRMKGGLQQLFSTIQIVLRYMQFRCIAISLYIIGLELDCPLKVNRSLVQLPLTQKEGPQIVMRFGEIGFEFDQRAVVDNRLAGSNL